MSDVPLATYQFLPWARRGVAALLNNLDQGDLPARASLDVQLDVTARQQGGGVTHTPASVQIQAYGPGDVLGLDPRHIIRTEPPPFTPNYEPNYLVAIEFDLPDLPWLFTPAAPDGDRLRPWISLIVLKDGECTPPSGVTVPLPVVTVNRLNALQNLDDSWNWAHVQVSGDVDLSAALGSSPGRTLSRLLCPRRLDPDTHYTAFLVPAFELGCRVGLGEDVSGVETQAMSWGPQTTAPLKLPFYASFEFHTSDAGDFESLVRRLQPQVLPPEVGIRDMAADQPLANFPSAGGPLGLQGALSSPTTQDTPWPDPGKQNFQSSLQQLINVPAALQDDPTHPKDGDPQIVPPMYGRWHAAVQSVNADTPGWLNELNLDPRPRVMAGFGTRIVQAQRVQLLASAWQQMEGIERANQLLRQGQLARAAMLQTYQSHFTAVNRATLLARTAPVHSRVLASPVTTVRASVAASNLPTRALSATFQRIVRPLGPVHRRLGGGSSARLLERLNSGSVLLVPPAHPPGGMVSIDQISDHVFPPWVPAWLRPWLAYLPWVLLAIAALLLIGALLLFLLSLITGALLLLVVALLLVAAALALFRLAGAWSAAEKIRFEHLTPQVVRAVRPRPDFVIVPAGQRLPPSTATGGDSPDAQAFRAAAGAITGAFHAPAPDPAPLPPLQIDTMRTTLLTRLDPNSTVPARVTYLIQLPDTIDWRPVDPIEPIMAAPEFPQPMYEPLRDISQDLLLPGLDHVPRDTLGLLESNQVFLEAYLVGLNHEMARQLLWSGVPCDQRGSYFRQFWDVRTYVPGDPTDPAGLRERLKDIPPITTWPPSTSLGQHNNRTDIVPGNLTLLIRGELLRRYPNALIYACEAVLQDGQKIPGTNERYPLFRGTLAPDLTFLGFGLTAQQARGNEEFPNGWFFVFQEHATEPRFGLEPDASGTVHAWNTLAWTNFATGSRGSNGSRPSHEIFSLRLARAATGPAARAVAATRFAAVLADVVLPDFLSAALQPQDVQIVAGPDNQEDPNNAWGQDAAQTAYITLRRPFRLAAPAELMLPLQEGV